MTEYSNEHRIELANALDRLVRTNPDFAKVFIQDYTGKYILGLVDSLSIYDPSNPEYTNSIRKLEGVSLFKAYINDVFEQGQSAKDEEDYLSRTLDIEENHE